MTETNSSTPPSHETSEPRVLPLAHVGHPEPEHLDPASAQAEKVEMHHKDVPQLQEEPQSVHDEPAVSNASEAPYVSERATMSKPRLETVPAPGHFDAAPPAARRGGTPIWLTGVVAIVLAGAVYFVWQDRQTPQDSEAPRIAALEAAMQTLQQRLAVIEQRPADPNAGRISTLETTVHDLAAKPAPDTSALEARLSALEKRPVPQIPDVAGAVAGASAALTAKIDTLDSRMQQDLAQATAQANARATLAAQLRTASTALQNGQPLGDIPQAPPALAKFAQSAPPTEPMLRQSFGTYAKNAEAASQPSAEGHDFAERMWMRAQGLVTVRQGDKVLVGAPAAVTLETARGKLDAGDLQGAVAALAPLDPAATAAMAPWKAAAQSVLDARAALATMAAKS